MPKNIPKNILSAKLLSSMALTALLLGGGAGIAMAQTYTTDPSMTTGATNTTTVTPTNTTTVTPATTGTTGTPNASDTGAINPASTTPGTTGTTPGVPNTGAGGDAATNLAILAVTGIIAVGGTVYLARKRTVLG